MSDTGVCNSWSDSQDGEVSDKEREDVLVLENDLSSAEHGLENISHLTEDVTSQNSDCSHYVTSSVYIALAVPKGEEVDVPGAVAPEKAKKHNRGSSAALPKAHKAQSWYHIEYKLLSGDTQPVKVDIVCFGPVAKMYTDDEFKILKTWNEENRIWICWSHDFHINVSRSMLISLPQQKITLQIWNTKNRMCSQARYDRLRVFTMPQDQPEDTANMCDDVKTIVNKVRSLCAKKHCKSKKDKRDTLNFSSCSGSETENSFNQQRKTGFQNLTTAAYDNRNIKKGSTASVELSPIHLLAGEISVAERFPIQSCGVFDMLFNISLDRPLMSDQLKVELNPLVVTILSATSLPSSPVPFHVLQEKCMPVYCQYTFHKSSVHRTSYHEHAANIYFRDVNVILSGLMSPRELQEIFSGPPLQIEVHDRDRKVKKPNTAVTFCEGPDVSIHGKGTQMKEEPMPFNHHGIANLHLSELLLGKRSIEMHLPIKCVHPPLLPRNRNVADKAASEEPMAPGRYTDANSHLKVKVELACPLDVKDDSCERFCDGPFGRIIYLFHYENVLVMTKLRSEVLRINASAFGLSSCSLEQTQQALSNYTLNFKSDDSEDLDFVTGFHVLDTKMQIFVLEGLKEKAVRRLWEAVRMKLSEHEEEQVTVLYNSSLSFFKRIYDSLNMGLGPVHLCAPLENIMRRPLIYIRGLVPQPCFQALSRLSQLCHIRQLSDVVHYDLFPSADMILSMTEEYGLCVEQLKQEAEANAADVPASTIRVKRRTPLDTHNPHFCKRKDKSQQRDFIQENIKKVQEESEVLQKPRAAVLRTQPAEDGLVHNYSIQTFNSTEQAKELLQKEMAKVPGRRFTYSQQYHSATVAPGDVTSRNDHGSTAASTLWITSTSCDDTRFHLRLPDEARVEELRKPWRENILHNNTLKPVLSRGRWSWNQRYEDFELYSKPPRFFGTPPVTIHLAGDLLQQEQLGATRDQYRRWLKKLLPRSSTNTTHSNKSGFKCDTLQDILNDEPQKHPQRKAGLTSSVTESREGVVTSSVHFGSGFN